MEGSIDILEESLVVSSKLVEQEQSSIQQSQSSDDYSERNADRLLDIHIVEKLYKAVQEGNKTLDRPLTPCVFIRILQEETSVEPEWAQTLFQKIDWPSMHSVSWEEFYTFLQMKLKTQEQRVHLRQAVDFWLPAITTTLPHRDYAVSVMAMNDGLWVTASTEATLVLWDNKARLKRCRLCLSAQRMRKKNQKQWITDATLMPEFNKVILATGNHELQFFDMASFGPFCQVSGLDTIPITIHYKALSREKCLLVYGDEMGCVNILVFLCMGKSFRLWKKLHKHEDFIPSIPVDQAISDCHVSMTRWQVHKDWVSMARYYIETDQIVSCSRDPNASLVIGWRRGSTNVAKMRKEKEGCRGKRTGTAQGGQVGCRTKACQDHIVYTLTRGVTVFDFSPKMKIVATGGCDQVIRLWNSFLTKTPMAKLCGHYHEIKFLHICHSTKRLYSICSNRWVKVWDVLDHVCLVTVPWHAHLVTGELRSVCFSAAMSCLALLGDNLGLLKIRDDSGLLARSHKQSVSCILYNHVFNHIISAAADSTVRTWSIETGRMVGEFLEAHGSSGITDMTLDSTMKRLITFATNGTGKMWNYHTGQCMRTFQPGAEGVEITSVVYADMRNVKYVMTGGWTHRVNRYIDDTPETIPFQLPLLPAWRDDLSKGHTTDILCCDYSQRDKMATGDDAGQVMVWNVETGYRIHLLSPVHPHGWSQKKLTADPGVSCLHFLKQRSKQRRGGNLVVGGPCGHVSLWNTNFIRQATLLAHFPVSPSEDEEVVAVAAIDSDEDNAVLVTGDSSGHVTVWDLDNYAIHQQEAHPPPCVCTWLAHAQRVTSLLVVKERRFVVTASADSNVRLWTLHGVYIGTFGQFEKWDVDDPLTYKNTELPAELCLDRSAGDEIHDESHSTEDLTDTEMVERPVNLYQPGLSYFARKKAVLSKRGRHLNDEVLNPFCNVGTTIPYHSLRHHELNVPPAMPLSRADWRRVEEENTDYSA